MQNILIQKQILHTFSLLSFFCKIQVQFASIVYYRCINIYFSLCRCCCYCCWCTFRKGHVLQLICALNIHTNAHFAFCFRHSIVLSERKQKPILFWNLTILFCMHAARSFCVCSTSLPFFFVLSRMDARGRRKYDVSG